MKHDNGGDVRRFQMTKVFHFELIDLGLSEVCSHDNALILIRHRIRSRLICVLLGATAEIKWDLSNDALPRLK